MDNMLIAVNFDIYDYDFTSKIFSVKYWACSAITESLIFNIFDQ